MDSHVSEKQKISSSMEKGSLASRMNLYPEPSMPIRREIHAPCRGQKSGRGGNFYSSSCSNRKFGSEGLSDKSGEFFLKYEFPKKRADDLIRSYMKRDKTDSVTEVIDLKKEADIVDLIQYCKEEKGTASVSDVIDLEKETENNKVGFFQEVELVSESEGAGWISETLVLDSKTSVHEKLSKSAEIRNDDFVTEELSLEIDAVDLKQYRKEETEIASVTEVIGLGKEAVNNKVGFVQEVELVSESEDAGRILGTLVLDSETPVHEKLPKSADIRNGKFVTEELNLEREVDIVDLCQYGKEKKETGSVTEAIDLEIETGNNKFGFVKKVELVPESEDAGRILEPVVLDMEKPVHVKLAKIAEIGNDKFGRLELRLACFEKRFAKFRSDNPVKKPDPVKGPDPS